MPTNLVPKTTGSGSLGTDAKRWKSINAITGSIDHINESLYVSGDITASGIVKADSFQSVTGGIAIDFNDDLDVGGDILARGDITIETAGELYFSSSANSISNLGDDLKIHSTDDIFIDAGDAIVFKENLTTKMYFNDGKLQIGIPNPGGNPYDNTPPEMLTVYGNISASDNLIVSGISASSDIHLGQSAKIYWYDTDTYIQGSSTSVTIEADNTFLVKADESITFQGNITATGDISASGTIVVNHITASGHISTKQYGFGDVLVKLHNSSDDGIVSVYSNKEEKIKLDGATGDISASGTIIGSNLSGTNTGDQSLSTYIQNSQTGSFLTTSPFTSAGISGSWQGQSFLTTSPFTSAGISGSWNKGVAIDGDITATGNISASAISASGLTTKTMISGMLDTLVELSQSYDDGIVSVYQGGSEVIKLDGATGDISASGTIVVNHITASGHISTKQYGWGDVLVKLHNLSDDGIVSVYQNKEEKIKLSGAGGHISASGNITASGIHISDDYVNFNDLPNESGGLSSGRLYTQSGSQLPFSGSHSYGTTKFVLIK